MTELSPSPTVVRQSLRVQVADATAVGRQLAAFLLQKRGHQVSTYATVGELLTENANIAADLVLMDLGLGEQEVLAAARLIRNRETREATRVIVVALSPSPIAHLGRCLEAGFDAVLAVPLDPIALDVELVRMIGPAVNEQELLNRLGGRKDLVRQVQQALQQSMASWQAELDAALVATDAERVRRVGHQMKGALANLSAQAAAADAKLIEDLGRNGNLTCIEAVQGRLWNELARVVDCLNHISSDASESG